MPSPTPADHPTNYSANHPVNHSTNHSVNHTLSTNHLDTQTEETEGTIRPEIARPGTNLQETTHLDNQDKETINPETDDITGIRLDQSVDPVTEVKEVEVSATTESTATGAWTAGSSIPSTKWTFSSRKIDEENIEAAAGADLDRPTGTRKGSAGSGRSASMEASAPTSTSDTS